MGWLSGGLAVVCVVVGLFHLARLAVRRRDAAGELAHAAMCLGMAAMFSPIGDPVPEPVWTGVFVLCAAWFAVAVLRSRTLGGDAPHHVVCSGTMLFMLAAGHGGTAADGAAHAGHAAHGGGTAGALGMASLAALVLTAYFAWHALRCADRCRRDVSTGDAHAPDDGTVEAGTAEAGAVALRAGTWTLAAPQLASAAHLVMAVAMAVMLLGMI